MKTIHCILLVTICTLGTACTKKIVSDKTIRQQKSLTKSFELTNQIPVTLRKTPESPIIAINISFDAGMIHGGLSKARLANRLMWNMMARASKKYPKEKINELIERYSLAISCSEGIELSDCSLMVVEDYLEETLPVLADVIKNPALTAEDFALSKARTLSALKSTPSDPARYVNELVNTVFYTDSHPFSPGYKNEIQWLEETTLADVKQNHKNFLASNIMSIYFVGNMKAEDAKQLLNKHFGDIKKQDIGAINVAEPKYDKNNSFAFEHRDIPTAYLRFKFNAPSATDKDYAASKLMFHILSKKLSDEVRTKRSLSYATYSFTAQFSIGYGAIEAWTSKPKETLEAIKQVIDEMKDRRLSTTEIKEYKTIFATSYFLKLETNESIANSLAMTTHYLKDPLKFYDYPRILDKVSSQDVKRLANKVLKDFRLGVIYHKDKFKREWFTM